MGSFSVALISHEFPPYMFGGISSNCLDLAYALSKNRIYTTVVSGKPGNAVSEEFNSHLKIIRLPCIDLPPRYLWFQLQNFKFLSKLLVKHDVIHGVNPLSSAFSIFLMKRARKPIVTSVHEIYSKELSVFLRLPFSLFSSFKDFVVNVIGYPLNESLVRICLMSSDHVVVCGFSTYRDILDKYCNIDINKISIIPNGINFDKINSIREDGSDDDFSITFFGRLVARKGILHLLKAVIILKKIFPRITLHIFGDGPLKEKLKEISIDYKIYKHLIIHGRVPYEQLIKNIKRSTVIALPSLYEVGPFISALEAMACRKPVVAFDFPFTREFISNMSTGVLVKPGDIKDLVEKIALLLSDKSLRTKLADNAYNYVKTNHNWDNLVQDYIRVYKSLIE